MPKNKKIFIFSFSSLAFLILIFLYMKNPSKFPFKNIRFGSNLSFAENKKLQKITINHTDIFVEIAETEKEKSQGLSGRKSMPENQGMLFVFKNKTQPTFWMKDMNFAIDIIWIADGRVVGIEKGVPAPSPGTPQSKLPLYRSPTGIDYVLEVDSGFSEKYEVEIGSEVDLSIVLYDQRY